MSNLDLPRHISTAVIISSKINVAIGDLKALELTANEQTYFLKQDEGDLLLVHKTNQQDILTLRDLIKKLLALKVHNVISLVGGYTLRATNSASAKWHAIKDHINCTGINPLRGPNDPAGPRFPDMSLPYHTSFATSTYICAGVCNLLQTASEQKMMRKLGADVVSDELVHENIMLNHVGISSSAYICFDEEITLTKEDFEFLL